MKDVIDADHDKWSSSIIIIFGIRIDIAYFMSQYEKLERVNYRRVLREKKYVGEAAGKASTK